jgi:hypothetical protein
VIIDVRQRWRISSERFQWVIQKGRMARACERWDGIAYCKTLDSAIVWLWRRKVYPNSSQTDATKLEQLLRRLTQIYSDVEAAAKAASTTCAGSTIAVGNDWRLKHAPLQWILEKRRPDVGTERWDHIAYFGTLGTAVLRLAETRVRLLRGCYGADALVAVCRAMDRVRAVSERTSNISLQN